MTLARTVPGTATPTSLGGSGAPTPTGTQSTPGAGTVTATSAVSGTATVSRTATPTFPAQAHGRLRIGRVSGQPGATVSVDVILDVEEGVEIAGIQNDLLFDATRIAVSSTPFGAPDCAVNPDIDKAQTAFGFQPPGCSAPAACEGMRALVLSYGAPKPIASGSRLYTCNLLLSPDAELGSVVALPCVDALGASPDGNQIEIECEDGEVVVGGAVVETPTPSPTRTCGPASSPTACPPGETIFCNDRQCGRDCFCVPPTPTPSPASTSTAASGFRICGKAGERPVPDPPLARNVLFSLDPLGVSVFSTFSGIFCFENVTPGDYTISVREYVGAPSHCTEYGCWPDTPVTVVDSDILHIFIVMLPLPTPTPTAGPASTATCRCLENGGQPGPDGCPCDVEQCFNRCVDNLCPGTPNCMLECSFRCSCIGAPVECATHVDPGPTPTVVP